MFEMHGHEDLTGRLFGTTRVVSRHSRIPLTWETRCDRCGCQTVISHARLKNYGQSLKCGNASCGKAPLKPSPSLGATGAREYAIRSSDSASLREFRIQEREEQAKTKPIELTLREPTSAEMEKADPDTLAKYIDWKRSKL